MENALRADFFQPQTGYMHSMEGHAFEGASPNYGLVWCEVVLQHPVTGKLMGLGYCKRYYDDPWEEETYCLTPEMWAEGIWVPSDTIVRVGRWLPMARTRRKR